MLKHATISIVAVLAILAIGIAGVAIRRNSSVKNARSEVDAVLIGPEKFKPVFDQSVKSAKVFYDLYGKAGKRVIDGDYQEAIRLLNECLPHASMGPEYAMVYDDLAEIYRDLDDPKNELRYLEPVAKSITNEIFKEAPQKRVKELRQIIADPSKKNDIAERYPAPPIYGRSFRSYREVVAAQMLSKKFLDEAYMLLKDEKYKDAIESFKSAYYPNSLDNSFIEDGLIRCYVGLPDNEKALILLDHTLKRRSWSPKAIEDFQSKKRELEARIASSPSV